MPLSNADPTTASTATAREQYSEILGDAEQRLQQLSLRQLRMVWLRTICFFVAAGCLFSAYVGNVAPSFLIPIGWIGALLFLVAIVAHEHLRLAMHAARADQQLFTKMLARLDRRWADIPSQPLLPEFASLSYADDLDVDGESGLLTYMSLAGTYPGRKTLQSWVCNTPSWPEVLERQKAVRALTPLRELRLAVIRTVAACSHGNEDVYGLPEWSESPSWLRENRLAHTLSYIGPIAILTGSVGLMVFAGQGNTAVNIAMGILASGLLLNILTTVLWGS